MIIFFMSPEPPVGQGPLIIEATWSHSHTIAEDIVSEKGNSVVTCDVTSLRDNLLLIAKKKNVHSLFI